MKEYARVVANINLDAIEHNVRLMRNSLNRDTKLMAVIKTDGYGHGSVVIARHLEEQELADGFAVATAEEAVILRKAGIQKPVLIIGYTFPYCYEDLLRYDIIPTVFKEETLQELSEKAEKYGKELKIHIKVDTGMSRIGIRPDEDGLEFLKKAFTTKYLTVDGIFTHFAKADETDKSEAYEQLRRFQDFVKRAEECCGRKIPMKHCSNSAGILEMREANIDMVRAGIILYGLWPSEDILKDGIGLRPALELKSCIIYIKEVGPGTPISYNGTFVTKQKTRVATIPVGYGDGYPRTLSNKGSVLIHGKRCPILGRICMDQLMVDITEVPLARELDEVTLIGRDGGEMITAEELGSLSGRFNYELVCDLGKRIPRAYYKKQQLVAAKDYYDDYSYRNIKEI